MSDEEHEKDKCDRGQDGAASEYADQLKGGSFF